MDTLKQAGKRLARTAYQTGISNATHARNFPLVERMKDSFDCNLPFIMELKIAREQKTRVSFTFDQNYFNANCGGG